jgi:hypothetical protein
VRSCDFTQRGGVRSRVNRARADRTQCAGPGGHLSRREANPLGMELSVGQPRPNLTVSLDGVKTRPRQYAVALTSREGRPCTLESRKARRSAHGLDPVFLSPAQPRPALLSSMRIADPDLVGSGTDSRRPFLMRTIERGADWRSATGQQHPRYSSHPHSRSFRSPAHPPIRIFSPFFFGTAAPCPQQRCRGRCAAASGGDKQGSVIPRLQWPGLWSNRRKGAYELSRSAAAATRTGRRSAALTRFAPCPTLKMEVLA